MPPLEICRPHIHACWLVLSWTWSSGFSCQSLVSYSGRLSHILLVALQMVKLVATCKAILTRIVFGAHGFIAIWQVTNFKKNPSYWYLSAPILMLVFEGVFTLTIKDSQEWKW